jgi:hypothetical protein
MSQSSVSSGQPSTPAGRHVSVVTHGHCFDGLCSAVMFTRLLTHLHAGEKLRFTYHAAGYGPGQNGVDPRLLGGDINAILDFRFSSSPRLTWYFDHHVSAFPSEGDRAAYEAHAHEAARLMFHDGTYGSCTKLIADVGAARFGLDPAPMAELVRWADIIDSASFPSAEMAVSRTEPVLQLMTVVEHMGDDGFLAANVPRLLERPLDEVARAADVQTAYGPMQESNEAFIELVRRHAVEKGGVVLVDLLDQTLEAAAKFVTYSLYPESSYSVLVTRGASKCKISIGYNPWSPHPRLHNIAAICERHGGGGHPVVGAISLPPDRAEDARRIASDIAVELQNPPR